MRDDLNARRRVPSARALGGSALVLSALGAATMLACGLMSTADDSSPVNRCGGARVCGDQATCDPDLHICVSTSRPAVEVILRVGYPEASGVTMHEFVSRNLQSADPVPIALSAPVTVEGWVAGGDPLRTVAADITLSRPSPISGEPESVVIASTGATTWSEDAVAFSAAVLPYTPERGAYTAYVEPTGDDAAIFPPVVLTGVRIEQPAGRPAYPLTVPLPPIASLRRVVGRVMWGVNGVPNLAVQAEDPLSGLRVSTLARTATAPTTTGGDAEGTFEIFLPDNYSTDTFRLVVAPTAENPTVPTTVWDGIVFNALDTNGDRLLVFNAPGSDPLPDQPALALPPFTLVSLEGTVEGPDPGGVLDATLRFFRDFQIDTPGVTATFEQRAQTGLHGKIIAFGCDPSARPCPEGVALIEGDYSVTVTPPADCTLASKHLASFRIARPSPEDPVQRGQVFPLQARADLRGEVFDLRHRPAGALTVESRLVAPAETAAGAELIYLNSVINDSTDFDGSFDMAVEPGTHVLVVRPADSSRFPWRLVPNLPAPDGPVTASLEAPVVLDGSVTIGVDAAGVPLSPSGMTIEALVVDESFGSGATPVGKAVTDSTGNFVLLLSPSL